MEKGWLEDDPTKGVSLPRVEKSSPKHLTHQEQKKLLETIQAHAQRHAGDGRYSSYPWLIRFIRLNTQLGMRPTTALRLRWKDSDLTKRTVQVERTKTGKRRTIPLPQGAAEHLSRAEKVSTTTMVLRSPTGPLPTRCGGCVTRQVCRITSLCIAHVTRMALDWQRRASPSIRSNN